MVKSLIERLAAECGFELAGVAPVDPPPEFDHYRNWVDRGLAGGMSYLTDHRADLRQDPRNLLPSAKSEICVGKLYNTEQPRSIDVSDSEFGWISRYAWGCDYHDVLRSGLEQLAVRLRQELGFEFAYRVCVDTAPILERALAYRAGLGWLGKNTCLINQQRGSWFFLGELLTSLELEPGTAPPDRCGSCTRCIDACPTSALIERDGRWELDARLCISYLTIEHKGSIAEERRPGIGRHVFGCDICQDVCPWNRQAPITGEQAFLPRLVAPPLEQLAAISAEQFRELFRTTPVWRTKYRGFLRNVAIAMGNSGQPRFRAALQNLARHLEPEVAESAQWALQQLQ